MKHRFSVFTATFNRSKDLINLFNDLCNQNFKDFEWVVVNDGSTDNTDQVMAQLIATNKINIVYVSVPVNGGKHKAWREGLKNFTGKYVVTADDDDPLLPDTLDIHNKYWLNLEKEPNYDEFWEVRTRCADSKGNLIGARLPEPYYDSDYIEVNMKMNNAGEMNGSRKVNILRNEAGVPPFLFEDKCSNFPENIRWIRAARKYKTRFVPDITRIYEPNQSGLIKANKSQRAIYNSLVGALYMLRENRDILISNSIKSYLLYICLLSYKSAQAKESISQYRLRKSDSLICRILKPIFSFGLYLRGNK